MKRTSTKLFIYSLTSLVVSASSFAFASQAVTVPILEGGITASIGTFYVSPTANGQGFAAISSLSGTGPENDVQEVDPDYQFGFEASLGYVFEDTPNGIELSYRNLSTSDDASATADGITNQLYMPAFTNFYLDATTNLDYDFNALDLMLSQYLDIGSQVQMRFSAGVSYLDLEKKQTIAGSDPLIGSYFYHEHFFDNWMEEIDTLKRRSTFEGFGPRLALDARYAFADSFGIVAGGSLAYYIGTLDAEDNYSAFLANCNVPAPGSACEYTSDIEDDLDNHGVTNLRGNVGIDYVYFAGNAGGPSLGVELGYQVDYYTDAILQLEYQQLDGDLYPVSSDAYSFAFSGLYLNLKGVF